MEKHIVHFDDQIAGVNVEVRFYFDNNLNLYSFRTNPQLKDASQIDYYNFGSGGTIDKDLIGLLNKYHNSYKKMFTNVVEQRQTPNF